MESRDSPTFVICRTSKKINGTVEFFTFPNTEKASKYNNAQIESSIISKNALFTNPLFLLILYIQRYEIDFTKIDFICEINRLIKGKER